MPCPYIAPIREIVAIWDIKSRYQIKPTFWNAPIICELLFYIKKKLYLCALKKSSFTYQPLRCSVSAELKGNRVRITDCRATVSSKKNSSVQDATEVKIFGKAHRTEQVRRPALIRFDNAFAKKAKVEQDAGHARVFLINY
jgi:hypothetical protein